jgi:hypothetical protein
MQIINKLPLIPPVVGYGCFVLTINNIQHCEKVTLLEMFSMKKKFAYCRKV